MKKDLLLDKIHSLNEILQKKIDYLGCGGCGIFCYLMYKQLNSLGIETQIVAFNEIEISHKITNISNCINNKEFTADMACSHFLIEAEGILFDGYNVYEQKEEMSFGKRRGSYSLEQLEVALNHGSWNSLYDKNQNTKLAYYIKMAFA